MKTLAKMSKSIYLMSTRIKKVVLLPCYSYSLGTMLFALDNERGLYIFDIFNSNKFTVRPFIVDIKNAKAFDFY